MTWVYSRSARMLGILAAASGPAACEVTEVEDDELLDAELVETELRLQMYAPIELEAEADTYVRGDEDWRRNDNYGCQEVLKVGTNQNASFRAPGAPDAMRSLVRFDLSGIIGVDSVRRATLELSLAGFDMGADESVYSVQAHRVRPSADQPWIEGNGFEFSSGPVSIPPGCTNVDAAAGVAWQGGPDPYNDQSTTHGMNNETQPSFDPTVIGSITIAQSVHKPGDVFEMDVTSLVNDWLSGAVPNEGILLRDVTTDWSFRGVELGTYEGEQAGGVAGPRLVLDPVRPFPYVEITALDSVVALSWNPRPGATYYVERGSEPDFIDGTLVASGLTVGEYSESFVPDDPDAHYYRVAEDAPGPDTWSAVMGRIPVPVRHSTSYAHSKVPICLAPQPYDANQQMLMQEQPLTIHWWDPVEERLDFDAAPFDAVLDLELNEFYAVRTAPTSSPKTVHYQVTGRVPTKCEMALPAYEGINAVVWPVTEEPTKASDLLRGFLGAVAVGRWDVAQRAVLWHPALPERVVPGVLSLPSNHDFEIEPCTALYLYIDDLPELPNGQPIPIYWPGVSLQCE